MFFCVLARTTYNNDDDNDVDDTDNNDNDDDGNNDTWFKCPSHSLNSKGKEKLSKNSFLLVHLFSCFILIFMCPVLPDLNLKKVYFNVFIYLTTACSVPSSRTSCPD